VAMAFKAFPPYWAFHFSAVRPGVKRSGRAGLPRLSTPSAPF
jgi:hypothetical protein